MNASLPNGTDQESWRGEPGEIGFREYWRILVHRRNVVLICLVFTVLTAMLVTLLSTPQYLAATTLQIGRQGPEILTFQDVLGYDPAGYRDFYETQFKILQSETVAEIAAERLDLANRPEFVTRKASPLSRAVGWMWSLVAASDADTSAVDPNRPAVEFIQENLNVQLVRNSFLVQISFMDRDPELARDVANAVGDAYQQFNLEARFTTTDQASEFLTKEVARVRAEVSKLERELLEYGDEKAIVAIDGGAKDINEQALADLSARLTSAQTRLAAAQARYEETRDTSPDALAEVLSSPLIHRLKEEVAELERQHSQLRKQFKPGWPALSKLEEGLEQARTNLQRERQTIADQVRDVSRKDYELAVAEVNLLKKQIDTQRLLARPRPRDSFGRLSRATSASSCGPRRRKTPPVPGRFSIWGSRSSSA